MCVPVIILTVFSSSSFVYYESIKRELKIKPIYECRCDERHLVLVYYESIKRDLKTRPIYECRCDERLKDQYLRNLHSSHTLGCSGNWNT